MKSPFPLQVTENGRLLREIVPLPADQVAAYWDRVGRPDFIPSPGCHPELRPSFMFHGVDHGNGEDWTVEVDYQRNPDGSITVVDQRAYHSTIDAKAVDDFTRNLDAAGLLDENGMVKR